MVAEHRSSCPINLTLEVLGDRWSLLVIRDLAFGGPRHFRQLMQGEEGISSNILTARIERLSREGLLAGSADPTHSQRIIYRLTEKGVDLVPVLIQLGVWGSKHTRCSKPLAEQGRLLAAGGPPLWKVVHEEVRRVHLGRERQDGAGPLQKALHICGLAG